MQPIICITYAHPEECVQMCKIPKSTTKPHPAPEHAQPGGGQSDQYGALVKMMIPVRAAPLHLQRSVTTPARKHHPAQDRA